MKTFNDVLKRLKPKVWMIQETKLKSNETISCEALQDYQVFYRNRQDSQGGGIAMGVEKSIRSTLIRDRARKLFDIVKKYVEIVQTCTLALVLYVS